MATFSALLENIRHLEKHSEKAQLLAVVLNAFQNKKTKLSKEDQNELTEFAFSEFRRLISILPTVKSYREKDEIFGYADQMYGIIMLCYAKPDEIAAEDMNTLRTLRKMINKERFVENAIDDIFSQGNNGKDDVERLLCALTPLKDEYQKGQLYQGMLHYQQNIRNLPADSKALFADYISSEIKRYLDSEPDDDMVNNLELACDVSRYFINGTLIFLLNDVLKIGRTNVNYYAAAALPDAGQSVSSDVIAALAEDLEYAALTYELMKKHGLTGCFPAEFATPEYLAKSDMVHWLTYPTELGKQPDRIEYLGKVKKKEEYYIFRFLSHSDTLDDETKGKWLIGWSSEEGGTFSNFDLYEDYAQDTVEKTLKAIKKKIL